MATRKKATVIETRRGGIESWDCSECSWFTHGDAEMAATHAASHNKAPKVTDADDADEQDDDTEEQDAEAAG